jgi:hypothetical protein
VFLLPRAADDSFPILEHLSSSSSRHDDHRDDDDDYAS